MINRAELYQNLVKCEKEAGVKLTPQHRNIVLDVLLECYREAKVNELNKSDGQLPELFRNFIRTNHLTSKWELYLKENEGNLLMGSATI